MPATSAEAAPVEPEDQVPDWLENPDATPVIPEPRPGVPFLRQPSKWTCMPTAFAMVLAKGHPAPILLLGDILHQLGRDDERGFHAQELVGIGITLKVAFVPIEQKIDMERAKCFECRGHREVRKKVDDWSDYDWEQCRKCEGSGEEPLPPMLRPNLVEMLKQHDGVLVGSPKNDKDRYHAVAWCHETQRCLDPDGPVYDIEQFDVDTFWAAFRLNRDED